MRVFLSLILMVSFSLVANAQAPPTYNSADIYLQLKKLKVLGSVLYVAAHPDDENTRLIAWLSKERQYRTGYLSITRGDGGQNLIGDEQGIDLGLIRTQELLAARRIDGGEQFFTRAYDFGFSKTTEETFKIWDKDKVLSDVVWIIRKFQPDIIVARFPGDARAGHGHHSGSSVLAREAFKAAADPAQYPEQLQFGIKPWQAKRIFWNTFNFGNTNTTAEDQLKIDVGGFNPILGKSYGELAAESRSQHKSQGFGVPSSRGEAIEYFTLLEGEPAKLDIMDNIITDWRRIDGGAKVDAKIDSIIATYSLTNPSLSVKPLVALYSAIESLPNGYWTNQKLSEVKALIQQCSGLWLEASANSEYAVQGDSIRFNFQVNNRLGAVVTLNKISWEGMDTSFNMLLIKNKNLQFPKSVFVSPSKGISQPYWMARKMNEGSFNVDVQQLIGLPENPASFNVVFDLTIEGLPFSFTLPVKYKYTDPVRGELYHPLVVVPPVSVTTEPSIVIFRNNEEQKSDISIRLSANRNMEKYSGKITERMGSENSSKTDSTFSLARGLSRDYYFTIGNKLLKGKSQEYVQAFTSLKKDTAEINPFLSTTSVKYDHIPHIHYFYQDAIKVLNMDLKISGKKVGYIEGAGDKVPIALSQMGYEVTILKEKDIANGNLKQFDAIMTGVRAYNVNEFMAEKYEALMNYVKEGGNLIVQYNTNNFISNVRSKIGPYPFNISRSRVTDEKSPVEFLIPNHQVLQFPNKITMADFEGWVQERSIYNADQPSIEYEMPIAMTDPGPAEKSQSGSLIIASYGKGKFVYTGLVFFRELPAGVSGAYRLLANIIALNKKKPF